MLARIEKPAPDFTAKAYTREGYRDVKLSDYRGTWVVLFFYPGDYTFVCPTELTDLARRYSSLREAGVEVLAVSTDSHHVHRAWQEAELSRMVEGGIPYPMLSDPTGGIGTLYGVFDDEAGIDQRGRFIIDPDGVLKASEVVAESLGRNAEELLRQISALTYARQTGQVTPSCWMPGQATLTPGEALVGKVWEVWKP